MFGLTYEYFECVSGVGDAFRMLCSNSCFDVWLYEFDPLKQAVLHSIALENSALLLHSYLLFHFTAFPLLFQGVGTKIPIHFHSLKQIVRGMNKSLVHKISVMALVSLVLKEFLCLN